jgi:pSer/pThr/pTyr-binding forkhead associated (FHA) protein
MSAFHLVIIQSPAASDVGRRFDLERGTWRVLGRALSQLDATIPLTQNGDKALDADRQDLVDRRVGQAGPARIRSGAKRGPDVDLHDEQASRTHAMVFLDTEGALSVVDLMSTNGTQVNKRTIQDVDVQPGDVVLVGKTHVEVRR